MNDFERLAILLAAVLVENAKLREQLSAALANQKKSRKKAPETGEPNGV